MDSLVNQLNSTLTQALRDLAPDMGAYINEVWYGVRSPLNQFLTYAVGFPIRTQLPTRILGRQLSQVTEN